MQGVATTPAVPTWTLGDRLRKARTCAGLTQVEMAHAMQLSTRTIANYEGDETTPRHWTIVGWARVTHVPEEWLLTGVAPVRKRVAAA